MSYVNEGVDVRAEVQHGLVDSVVYFAKRNGAPINPDNASVWCTLLDRNGGEVVARTQSGVSQNSSGRFAIQASFTSPTWELAEDCIAVWEWQESGTTFSDRQFFDVVKTKLPCLVDTSDVTELYPQIPLDLVSLGETDASKFIRRAWSLMLDRLRSGGGRPSLIIDRARLVNPGVMKAVELITDALSREADDIWERRSLRAGKVYEKLMAGLGELKYDTDQDGTGAEEEKANLDRRNWHV